MADPGELGRDLRNPIETVVPFGKRPHGTSVPLVRGTCPPGGYTVVLLRPILT